MRRTLAAIIAALALPGIAHAKPGCRTQACERRVQVKHARWDAHWCRRHRACVARVGRKMLRREIRAVTPFPGPHHTRWAIPYPIVACEGGWNGWGTLNHGGSGAAGPYQLLGWGAPMPAWTLSAQLAHHRIAARLWRSSGSGPWASSAGCWGGRL